MTAWVGTGHLLFESQASAPTGSIRQIWSTGSRLTLDQPSSGILSAWTKTSSRYGKLHYKPPRRVLETVSMESLATHLEQLPTRRDVWCAALLCTLTGAAIVIGWTEVLHRVCL